MPFPFHNQEFTFTQPDGTQFKVIGSGDQHYAVFETLDGHTVVQDPATGFYHYATLAAGGEELEPSGARVGRFDPTALNLAPHVRVIAEAARASAGERFRMMTGGRRCEQRRQERRALARATHLTEGAFAAPPSRGTSGNIVGLCLLVDFSDEEATISREQVDDYCNLEGYHENGNNGSVHDYFNDNSHRILRYTNVVTAYYRANHPKTHYTDRTVRYGTRARQLIREALDHLRNQGFDFNQLTADSEGYIYAMNVFYAGFNQNNWSEGLWPHAWNLASPYNVGSGKKLYDYQFTDMKDVLELGTFCHENGHMVCDYPDLYDKAGFKSQGAGKYCLMAGGGHGKNPSQISAYLKYRSGWSTSLVPITHGAEISLSSDQNEHAIYKKSETEYFIVENRAQTGRDAELPDAGLTIWHVDELGDNSNEQMTPALHFELSLEQADNQFDLERGRNRGDSGDLYHNGSQTEFSDDTSPNSQWWDGTASNLKIHQIGPAGPTMTFRANLHDEMDGLQTVTKTSNPNRAIPDWNSVGISDTITIDEEELINSISISVDIEHTYRGDLRVTLHTPFASSIVLHQRFQGGSADDIQKTYDPSSVPALNSLIGRSVKGDWSLQVQDLGFDDEGTLVSWGLACECAAPRDVELEESPGTKIPDDDPAGIERKLRTDAAGTVSDIEVSVDITHTFIRDLIVTLLSPSGTTVHLHHQIGGGTDDIVKTYTVASTPGLGSVVGESMQGDWTLRVSDHEGADKGKLNFWRVKLKG